MNDHYDWTTFFNLYVVFKGGLFFVEPMRAKNFVTLLDPFHVKYGKVIAAGMSLVSVLNDTMWVPITLTGLGKWVFVFYSDASTQTIYTWTLTKKLMHLIGGAMSVVLDLPFSLCIWISAAVAIIYTLLGGLYSVAYTDVVQLFLIFCSLVMHHTFQSLLLKHIIKVLVMMATFVFCFVFDCSGSVFPLFWPIRTPWTSVRHWSTTLYMLPGLVKCSQGALVL